MTDQKQLQEPFTITVDGKKNCLDLTQKGFPYGGPATATIIPGGIYRLSYGNCTIKFHNGDISVKKVVVYNTNNDPNGWFWTLEDNGSSLIIDTSTWGTANNTLYAFVIDITGQDNSGTGTLTVKQIG